MSPIVICLIFWYEIITLSWRLSASIYQCFTLQEDNLDKVVNEDNSKQHRCRLCKIQDYMNQIECLLFMKELDREGVRTEGTENPSIEMIVLKSR